MSWSARAGFGPRGIAAFVAAALVAASLVPCAAPAGGEGRAAAPHAHAHSEAQAANATVDSGEPVPSLWAVCPCGCTDTPGADANPTRLPVALLAAAGFAFVFSDPVAAHADLSARPEPPRDPVDHVPLCHLA